MDNQNKKWSEIASGELREEEFSWIQDSVFTARAYFVGFSRCLEKFEGDDAALQVLSKALLETRLARAGDLPLHRRTDLWMQFESIERSVQSDSNDIEGFKNSIQLLQRMTHRLDEEWRYRMRQIDDKFGFADELIEKLHLSGEASDDSEKYKKLEHQLREVLAHLKDDVRYLSRAQIAEKEL